MTAKTARKISRRIRGSDKEPGQYGAVDHPYGLPTAPQLEEGCGGNVLSVVRVRRHSESVTVDTAVMKIEESYESVGITRQRCIPGPGFVPKEARLIPR
jgi:hypothetical protein